MPSVIAATAIRDWVTVLPEPVAPTTSVWAPPPGPPNGTITRRQRSSWPSSRVPARDGRTASSRGPSDPEPHPRGEGARGAAVEDPAGVHAVFTIAALTAANPPARQQSPEADRQGCVVKESAGENRDCDRGHGPAPVHAVRRISRAAIRPTSTASRHSAATVVSCRKGSSSCGGRRLGRGMCRDERGHRALLSVCAPPSGGGVGAGRRPAGRVDRTRRPAVALC